jgi:hypothetical protein
MTKFETEVTVAPGIVITGCSSLKEVETLDTIVGQAHIDIIERRQDSSVLPPPH